MGSQDREFEFRDERGTGCGCGFLIPPAAVLLLAGILVFFALGSDPVTQVPADISSATSSLSGVFTPEVQYWSAAIVRWAADAGLDPNLVAVVMQIESCGDPFATSRAGAAGLFQVMPYHFAVNDDPYSPDTNASRGLSYLSRSLQAANGDARLALAGYNGGISRIALPEWTWADETARYAYWGTGIYADASSGATTSPRLEEWLGAGGASLCRTARRQLALQD